MKRSARFFLFLLTCTTIVKDLSSAEYPSPSSNGTLIDSPSMPLLVALGTVGVAGTCYLFSLYRLNKDQGELIDAQEALISAKGEQINAQVTVITSQSSEITRKQSLIDLMRKEWQRKKNGGYQKFEPYGMGRKYFPLGKERLSQELRIPKEIYRRFEIRAKGFFICQKCECKTYVTDGYVRDPQEEELCDSCKASKKK